MSIYILYIIIFFIGTIIGSFLSVCIYKIPRNVDYIFPQHHIKAYDKKNRYYYFRLILGYLFPLNKFGSFNMRISMLYLFVQVFYGIVFLLLFLTYGITLTFIKFSILCCFLIVIGAIDFYTTDVYSITTYSGIFIGLVFIAVEFFLGKSIITYLFGGLVAGLILLFIILTTKYIYKREGIGYGDLEICVLIGLYLGSNWGLIAVIFGLVLGGIVGILLLISNRKSNLDEMALGPYLGIASIIIILWIEPLTEVYLKFLGF